MINSTYFNEFQNKRALAISMTEAITELSQSQRLNALWVVLLLIAGWVLSLIIVKVAGSVCRVRKREPSKIIFYAAFHEKIRAVFKNQRKDTFETITMGVNRVLQRCVEEPTVFLLMVPCGAMTTATELVCLMIHCVLTAYQYSASVRDITSLMVDGNKYTSHNDEWPFYFNIKKHLRNYGISAVFAFDKLHPQVVKVLLQMTPLTFAPFPQSVLILVVDVRSRFTDNQKQTMTPNALGRIFLQEILGPYMGHSAFLTVIKQLGSRCILVNPEAKCQDSVLPFC